MDVCDKCDGRGWVPNDDMVISDPNSSDSRECDKCKGEGVVCRLAATVTHPLCRPSTGRGSVIILSLRKKLFFKVFGKIGKLFLVKLQCGGFIHPVNSFHSLCPYYVQAIN